MRCNVTGCAVVGVVVGWCVLAAASAAPGAATARVVHAAGASKLEVLAAREVRRYVYLRTGALLDVASGATDGAPGGGDAVVVARADRPLPAGIAERAHRLGPQGYLIATAAPGRVYLVGADDAAVLYAAYRYAERLGVGFGLDGDAIPDGRVPLDLRAAVEEVGRPRFELRGIQPFHDFPEGPDWWDLDDYKAVLSQLPKLRMNFIGLHTYPEGGVGPEPAVWIGPPGEVGTGARPARAYAAGWFNTLRGTWGYAAARTSRYSCGASQLFEADAFGPATMVGHAPLPVTPEAQAEVFERSAVLLREAFTYARGLGIKTCVGTETPLVAPRAVRERLRAAGLAPATAPWARAVGGKVARTAAPVAGAAADADVYRSVRWDASAYHLAVPNGRYTVTLKFAEIAYTAARQRVFGVKIQGAPAIDRLDLFAEVGKDRALDRTFRDVAVTDGRLAIEFVRIVEFPCIAGIVVEGPAFGGKVNCGGPAVAGYAADDGEHAGPVTAAEARVLYEGMFRRIAQSYPVDYYWLWTPEDWTWGTPTQEQVRATVDDLAAAGAAARAVNAPFRLATCGWVLGPPKDRALFDRVLPKDVPLSCINRQVGKDPVEPGFASVKGRPTWAIPWLEDDPNLLAPQLWAGRMLRDAADAARYGCTGLMGIHWRTRSIDPTLGALAGAAWDPALGGDAAATRPAGRFDSPAAFYRTWAAAQFGPDAAADIAAVFARVDSRLPEPSAWVNGPGGLAPTTRPWADAARAYAFIDELAALRPRVAGPANVTRFDRWLDSFRYMKALERVRTVRAGLEVAMKQLRAEKDAAARAALAESVGLPRYRELLAATGEAYALLLATVTTPGDLGTVCNFEQHVFPALLHAPAKELVQALGRPLPADAQLPADYRGPVRVILPTLRGTLAAGEALNLKILVLAPRAPGAVTLHWRELGGGPFARAPARHDARGVYRATLAPPAGALAAEYYVEVTPAEGEPVRFPASAPALNQTVVVAP